MIFNWKDFSLQQQYSLVLVLDWMLDASLEGRTECPTTKSPCGNTNNFSCYHTYEKKKSCSVNCIICSSSFQWVRSSTELAVTGWPACPSCLWMPVNLSVLLLVALHKQKLCEKGVLLHPCISSCWYPLTLEPAKKRSDTIAGEETLKHSFSSPSNTQHLVFLKASLFLP